jgi:hypothetical protein
VVLGAYPRPYPRFRAGEARGARVATDRPLILPSLALRWTLDTFTVCAIIKVYKPLLILRMVPAPDGGWSSLFDHPCPATDGVSTHPQGSLRLWNVNMMGTRLADTAAPRR